MRVLITGDSHTAILHQGQKALAERHEILIRPLGGGHQFPTQFFAERSGFVEITNLELSKQMTRLPPADSRFDWIGFSGPMHTVRVWRQDFRRHSPWPVANSKRDLISTALLRRVIRDDVDVQIALLDALRKITKVFVVEPPRPFRDHPAVQKNGEQSVLSICNAYRSYVVEQLKLRQIPIVGIDPNWCREDGFMDPTFKSTRAGDNHHGNLEFGREMMNRVTQFLDGNLNVCL